MSAVCPIHLIRVDFIAYDMIIRSKPSDDYMSAASTISNNLLLCIYGFRMILDVNRNYFLTKH
jgi:hypothetical protein